VSELYVGPSEPEVLLSALTADMDSAEAELIKAQMRAARAERERQQATLKPRHKARIARIMRRHGTDAEAAARALAMQIRLRRLPREVEAIASRTFSMDVPRRVRLESALRGELS
jgi:hypothetical protein